VYTLLIVLSQPLSHRFAAAAAAAFTAQTQTVAKLLQLLVEEV
jgi:hypothetical protein